MKTVIFIQVLYILINFEANNSIVNGAEKCESSIETRAVLLSCPEKDTGCEDDDPLSKATLADEYRLLQVKPSEVKKLKAAIEREFPNRVTECKRKLIITMKLNNKGKIECDDGFIVIDHVYDPITRGKARLLSPVIVKLRQEQMVQLYQLQFQKIVNSNPNENVFTKETCTSYKGCSTDLDNPTCGITTYNGEPIPFSEGFCCSCDPYVNAMREVLPDKHEDASQYKDPTLFGHQKNRVTRSKAKPSVLINPNLLNLKAGNRKGVRHVPSGEDDTDSNGDEELLEIPPNFLFERDRQIVCSPETLLKELCNLESKDSDGKDEDETNEDECDNASDDLQMKEVQIKNVEGMNNSSNDNSKDECQDKCGDSKPDGNQCTSKKDNSGVENVEKNSKNISSGHNSVASTVNSKAPAKAGNQQVEKDSPNDMGSYMEAVGSDSGGQYQFTGNSYLPRQLKNEKGGVKVIEIMHGKREVGNNAGVSRQRKKRLTRDNEDYNFSYQYHNDLRGRRNKRIYDSAIDKVSNSRLDDKINPESELCDTEAYGSSSRNCTLPVYFFSHDKSLLCPPCRRNQNTTMDQIETSDYGEMNMNGGSDTDNVEEAEEVPQMSQPALGHKPLRFRTNKGGVWDVNAKVHHGNIYRLDLVKSEDSPDHSDTIEEISYENKKFLPNFDDIKIGTNRYQSKSHTSGSRYNYVNPDRSTYELNKKLKEADRMQMLKPSKQQQQQYKPGSNRKANRYSGGNRKAPQAMKSEMEIIIPTKGNEYRKIALTSEDIERLRKANKDKEKNGLQYLLQNIAREAQAEEEKSQNRYGMYQDSGKETKLGKNNDIYYENSWKPYNQHRKYSSKWADKINDNFDERYTKESNERNNVVDLLPDNYVKSVGEPQNEIMVKSKNVFFTDSKSLHGLKRKDTIPYEDHYYDDIDDVNGQQESLEKRSDVGLDNPTFYKDDNKLLHYDWTQFDPKETPLEDNMRKRRKAGSRDRQDPYSGFQKLRNTQFVRNRGKRSIADSARQEPIVKISKWEHRTPPGPEYQFDVSTLTRASIDRTYQHSSGSGDRQCFREIQENFAALNPRAVKERKDTRKEQKMDRERLMQSYLTSPSKYKREIHNDGKGKRYANTVKRQERGGQVCGGNDGSSTKSPGEDLDRKYESSHCMKLSDLWYSVYLIKRPELAQLVGVQIYDKQTMCDGTTNWRDVTKGYMIRIGSFLQTAEDDVPTISVTYTPMASELGKDEPKLDTENYRLLIPSHLTNEKKSKLYPEFYGGPTEFLLVNKEEITNTGSDCNKIGTSFEAFARQPDRCTKPPGSCLKRQPVDLWREDMEARIRGKRGKYFIENFGNVSNTSIKTYSNLTGDFLAMDYYGEYSSVLEIEMRADGNAVVRQGENAQIPLVYIDSMASRKTKIVLSVMNMGLTSSLFRPRLGECPSNLDPTWCPLEGPLVQIPPQQRRDFKLELTGTLPAKKIRCAVEVLNHYNKKVASRKIIIKKSDRCLCVFYCKCICLAATKKHTCSRLKREEYNAAGYFDPLPRRSIPAASGGEAFLDNLKVVLISMLTALLILGLIKAVLGIFMRRLGIFGVQVIVGPRTLCQYYEPDICAYQVVYDECGFPIHPQTCKTVQIVPLWLEMFINLFFFYLYFLRVLWLLISSMPCCKLIISDCEVCPGEESECGMSKQKTSGNYSENYFTYNVMTFTSKKNKPEGNALYSPYKTDEDPLEEDDTEFVLEEIKRYKHKE